MLDFKKIYRFSPFEGLSNTDTPVGGHIYYECTCGDIVPSVSFIAITCECGNLSVKGGNFAIKDRAQATPVKGVLK